LILLLFLQGNTGRKEKEKRKILQGVLISISNYEAIGKAF